jgi:hypothetical protein
MTEGSDRLDELLGRFVDSDYAPEGAEVEGEHGGHGGHGAHHGDGHGAHNGRGAEPSVREIEYRGHSIRVVTRYEVTIDGEPWERPLEVMPDGNVVSHDLPQYVVPSALDLIRAVVDQSYEAPEEIRSVVEAAKREEER